mmetsp:Transcript_126755/g.253404  ORF Transcript_126755/g.253404 Transcript_126755/m.253404 type:complete len:241 (+) Transcript_126755:46-768(+)|eukprot:CAMPEP_0172700686 /NCGR_PEP_ID=MMETSP1074-20121228/31086_1 /TAXON_ID=2916 /ORGANISM="Ceratium fusus, Strain PA161109" /LENGTH=240 /DNA_ID=CAMNT_0013522111 /DNA_START=38 /DNA_END=760 /DNA_ORIENTATION=-
MATSADAKEPLVALQARITGGDWEARRAALEALGRRGCELEDTNPNGDSVGSAVALAASCLGDVDCHVRRAALTAIIRMIAPSPKTAKEDDVAPVVERIKIDSSWLERVLVLLQDEDWGVRRIALNAVAVLAEPGDAQALAALEPHLSDTDDDVRCAAVAAVGRVAQAGNADLATLVAGLLDDDDDDVRKAAVTSYARVSQSEDAGAIMRLRDIARRDEDPDVRNAAVSAMARLTNRGQA